MKLVGAFFLVVVAFTACSARRLPPGTPPPEYEPPVVSPWSPPSDDAGADPSPPSGNEPADAASPPAPESELSLDAGPR